MPRIDPLLTALVSNRADAVKLSDGNIAHIIKGGAQHPLTRQPLAEGQLLMLLKEMAPADVRASLSGAAPVQFVYSNSEGSFLTRVFRDNGVLQATVEAGAPVARPAVPPTNGNSLRPPPVAGGPSAANATRSIATPPGVTQQINAQPVAPQTATQR